MFLLKTGSQADLDFYIGVMKNERIASFQLYITTLLTADVSYTIEQKFGIIATGMVSVSNPAIVFLDSSLISLDSSYTQRNKGVRVHSNGSISLLVVNYQ